MSNANAPADVLCAQDIDVAFAGLRALKQVSLSLHKGQVLGLIGPNGAGKTTLVNVLTGFQPPRAGSLRLGAHDLRALTADAFRRLGIARTFQGGRLFKALTVLENLEVAGVGLGLSRRAARAQAHDVLAGMRLESIANRLAGTLPYIDERRVGIARAVVGRPHHLLMDEPAAGMNEHEAHELRDLIARLVRDIGCGVLLIEHNVRLVMDTCDPIVVMDAGEVIERGAPAQIQASERVRHAYMGTAAEAEAVVA
ncbi:ATP-binding cassette domain-containing protein [Ottowia sp.]|uniref:ABC transporter ATP-binding protein n=1 Tax=Ottowia sp. TaxID=1898956 RepID=UPI002BB38CA4|nr:ATP-binding cassette domain-containing protein [Ottowia sp.]HOB67700.1 ATP-binding cassette domain-containing protein [Ottowia sp.]HPZ58343.1 ATP-binding cassette domain-containing protein [Ottowia sp.]HQD48580.1 ATP-binding cassette domain-containing protein [Ottowia sp.]